MKRSISAIVIVLLLACSAAVRASAQSQAVAKQPLPAGPTGSLRIKTDVPDVQVIIDDKEAGRTPLTLKSIPVGARRLTLLKPGYEDHAQQVEVADQKTTSVFVVMKPVTTPLPALPVEFKVMHQHRFGYCVGVLTVSAKALDYKAEKDEDKFQLPIQTLKSVSRSWGPVPGMAPGGVNAQTDMMAFRIEAPDRAYGFLAYQDHIGEEMKVMAQKTKELFDIVYRLWTDTLKTEKR
jgi:hypothetical protein